jgi:hypothetical protein
MFQQTPSPQNLMLGAGEVFFDRQDADGASTGLRHLGNVDSFGVNTTVETIEKKNAMDGAKGTYAELISGVTSQVSLTLTEFTPENVALAVLGDSGLFTQESATVTDQSVGPADSKLDVWYDLGAINPTVTTVKQDGEALDAAAYELNAEAGMIRLLSGYTGDGKAVAGTQAVWSGTAPAIAATDMKAVVHALSASNVKGRIRYIAAANQNGPRTMIDIWVCGLSPDGDLGWISEDFATFNLTGKVYADTSKPVGQQYYRILYL